LDEIAQEYDWRLKIGKVNIDDQQNLAISMAFRAIPHPLLVFKKWRSGDQIVWF